MKPRAVVTCVEYADILAITLPRIRQAFCEVVVLTTPRDRDTIDLATAAGCRVHKTERFYENKAPFNKGAAIDEALHTFGKYSWMAVVDADIVFPENVDWSMLRTGNLYCPRRRLLPDPNDYRDTIDSSSLPEIPDKEYPGYCQVWDAQDPLYREPLYPVRWRHAGGSDSDFQSRWRAPNRNWLPWEVIHLGKVGVNWNGRVSRFLDGRVPEHAEERRTDRLNDIKTRERTRDYSHEFVKEV